MDFIYLASFEFHSVNINAFTEIIWRRALNASCVPNVSWHANPAFVLDFAEKGKISTGVAAPSVPSTIWTTVPKQNGLAQRSITSEGNEGVPDDRWLTLPNQVFGRRLSVRNLVAPTVQFSNLPAGCDSVFLPESPD